MKYNVVIKRSYDTVFEIEAENEIEADEKAQELFDELYIRGNEMYVDNTDIKEINE